MGKGEASALLKVADNAMPVVTTAQSVELSRRVRQTQGNLLNGQIERERVF